MFALLKPTLGSKLHKIWYKAVTYLQAVTDDRIHAHSKVVFILPDTNNKHSLAAPCIAFYWLIYDSIICLSLLCCMQYQVIGLCFNEI